MDSVVDDTCGNAEYGVNVYQSQTIQIVGNTATALAPDTLTDLGGGACFNDARVQVASLATA